jgi:hypothetical protein
VALFPTYGVSNLDVATNLVNMWLAYQVDARFQATSLYFWQQMAAVHAARPFFSPAQFGIEGPSAWEIYRGDVLSSTPLASYAGQVAYNH